LAPGATGALHSGQLVGFCRTGSPHSLQNLALGDKSAPQFAQDTVSGPGAVAMGWGCGVGGIWYCGDG